MRVLCKSLGGGDLLTVEIANGNLPSTKFHLTVGREYKVYGLLFTRAVLKYLIEDDTGLGPGWFPASLFTVACDRVSRYWRLSNWSTSERYFVVISFPEITASSLAFENLFNRDREARNVFRKREQLADLEFPDPSIKEVARLLEGDWLQCPFCADAWQSKNGNALVRCPACQKISNDPRYDVE
jgi:hypothetical protein